MKSPYRWVILLFLFAAFTLQFSTYLSWNPFIPLARGLFGFTASQSAIIVATVAFGRMLFQIPGGIVVDMFSAKRLLIISMFVLSLSTLIVGLTENYTYILLGQFLIGMSGVVVMPLCIKVVIECFPVQESDIVSGILNSAASVAVIVTNVLIPFVILHWVWNGAFYVLSAGCLAIAVLIFFFLRIPTHKESAIRTTNSSSPRNKKKFELANFLKLLKDNRFRLALAAHAGAIYTTWGINSWLAMYLRNSAGLPTETVSKMMLLFGLFGCISMATAGIFTRGSFKKRCKFLLAIFIITLLMLLLIPFIRNELILWIYVSLLGVIAFSHFGPLNIFVSNMVDSKFFATAMAISIFVWQIASIIQSLFIGKILDSMDLSLAYHFSFLIVGLGSVSSCIALVKVLSHKHKIKKIYNESHIRRAKA